MIVLAAASQITLGCAASSAVLDDVQMATVEPLATPTPESTPTPLVEPTAAPTPTPTPTPFQIDPDLAARLPEGWDPVLVGVLPPGPDESPPAGGVLGDRVVQESRWSYAGVLGRLKPKQRVVPRAAERPTIVAGAAPLTGVPAPGLADQAAVVVKIDNVPQARPQVGINQADVIYEELVEAGVTRLAAVFHSQNPGTVGPVRSGRSTDIGIVASFNEPAFAFSGANSINDRLIDKQEIENRGAEVWKGYWRNSSRRAPNNLFTSLDDLREAVDDGAAPKPHFAFRGPDEQPPVPAPEAAEIQLVYLAGASPAIRYEWNGTGWARWQRGTRHVDAAGVQLAPENVIVQFVNYVDTGMTDKFGEDLHEGVMVGAGEALIFTAGRVVEASWTRSNLRSPTTFTDADGAHIELTPGRTHVALVPPGGASWN